MNGTEITAKLEPSDGKPGFVMLTVSATAPTTAPGPFELVVGLEPTLTKGVLARESGVAQVKALLEVPRSSLTGQTKVFGHISTPFAKDETLQLTYASVKERVPGVFCLETFAESTHFTSFGGKVSFSSQRSATSGLGLKGNPRRPVLVVRYEIDPENQGLGRQSDQSKYAPRPLPGLYDLNGKRRSIQIVSQPGDKRLAYEVIFDYPSRKTSPYKYIEFMVRNDGPIQTRPFTVIPFTDSALAPR